MEKIYPALITDILNTVRYPGNGKSLTENGMVEEIRIDGDKVSLAIVFDRQADPFAASTVRSAEATLKRALGEEATVTVEPRFKQQQPLKEEKPLKNVKYKIAVSSGKGGVGKSTVAANLAVALASQGFKVGLLDADIFGPSMPKMFGVEDEGIYLVNQNGRDYIDPIEKYGVKMLSIGFVVDKSKAVVWRGTMASNALKQLITDAWWGELDFFIIDLPPGTSDIHLTTVQTLDLDGALIVTTPQEVAMADARKGIEMFKNEHINVPVLGIVENMSWFTPLPHPEERYYIFGNGGGERLAKETGVELLGQIPLVAEICEKADCGTPVSLALAAQQPSAVTANPVAEAFRDLSVRLLSVI